MIEQRSERLISKHLIDPDTKQPRKDFNDVLLQELRDSIITIGQQMPIAVFEKEDNRFQIVVGERRWRAFHLIESSAYEDMRAFVVPANTNALLWQMAENINRAGLNPLEEAQGYQRLLDEQKFSQEKIAAAVGKSQIYISRSLMLLKLPESAQKLVARGSLRPAAARVLVQRCATQGQMADTIAELSKQMQGIKRITTSAINRYLDAQQAPRNLHLRAKRTVDSTVASSEEAPIMPTRHDEQTASAERVTETSAVQRFISDLVGAGDDLESFVRVDVFAERWQGMEQSDQKELLQALVRISNLSQELHRRVMEAAGA